MVRTVAPAAASFAAIRVHQLRNGDGGDDYMIAMTTRSSITENPRDRRWRGALCADCFTIIMAKKPGILVFSSKKKARKFSLPPRLESLRIIRGSVLPRRYRRQYRPLHPSSYNG